MFKKLFAIMAAGSLLVGGAAQAGPVVTSGSISLSIQGLAPISIPTSGTITVSGSSTIVPAGYVNLPATLTIPVSATTAISQLKVTSLSNLTGTFFAGGATAEGPCPVGVSAACVTQGGVGGQMALTGTIFVSVVPTLVVIPVNLNSAGLGQGGSATAGGGQFYFEAAPWTTGVGQVHVPATTTSPSTTVSVVGSNSNTNGGPITLVTPTYVSALGNLLPIFTVLTLNTGAHSAAVPEPGSLLLIGTGIAGLALLGRRRK
jgi:hypothetical protein